MSLTGHSARDLKADGDVFSSLSAVVHWFCVLTLHDYIFPGDPVLLKCSVGRSGEQQVAL